MIDPGTPEGVPYDPEAVEFYEAFEDDVDDAPPDEENTFDTEDIDPVTELSWSELGIALGFGQEMIQGEIKDIKNEKEQEKSSAKEYKEKYINKNDKSDKKSKKTNTSHVGRDLRPFERFVNGHLADIAQKEFKKDSPFTDLKRKLRVLDITYNDLTNTLLPTHRSRRYGYITRHIEDLNMNICVDICNLLTECIAMDTSDILYVLENSDVRMATPQMKVIKKELTKG